MTTMSAANDATRYFGSKEAIAREKDAPPRPAESYASNTVGLTESMKKRAEKRAVLKEKKLKRKEEKKKGDQLMKNLAKLAKSAEQDEAMSLIDTIAVQGLRTAAGLFKKAEEEGYNPDAPMPLADASTKTHFGMQVYKQMMAQKREGMATQRALGVVLLQGRMSEDDWNEQARRVDEAQRRAHAIDVAAEMIKNGEVE